MEKETNESLLKFASNTVVTRIALIFAIIAALLFGWFAARWQLGYMLADLTSPMDPNAKAISQLAIDLAPADPFVKWFAISSVRNDFTNESVESSILSVENLIRSAPNHYVWWVELGRTYEQAGQGEKSEQAFQRAIELAPNYTFPHWQLGNFYLRSGKDTQAFAELKKAAETNAVYREQVFSIAWDYYQEDTQKLEEIAGNTAAVRASLAKFYAVKEKPAESLKMWNSLSDEEKLANSEVAKIIAQGLFEKRFYKQAIEFVRDLGIEPNAKAETVQNGGFEESIGGSDYTYFNWRTAKVEKIDIKLDPTQKHSGNRSLRVAFNTFTGGVFYDTYQIVTVTPATNYALTFWLKTSDLKSGGMPTLEIVDPSGNKIIAASESFPTGSNDWKQYRVEFASPDSAEAVLIRTSRSYCGENCPIVGAFWYDDFELSKIG